MLYYIFIGGIIALVASMFIVIGGFLWADDNVAAGFVAVIGGIFLIFLGFYSFFTDGQADISENKICHTCYSFYNKSESYCPKDGSELVFVNPANEETKAD